MRAAVLAAGFVSFACCLILHVVLWRVARPRSDIRCLLILFLAAPAVIALVACAVALTNATVRCLDRLDVLAVLLMHLALSSAYVQTYPAAQARSPSLEIAYAVGRSMPRGLSREELLAIVDTGRLVDARVEDLLANRLVRREGDRYGLTALSTGLVRVVLVIRFLLGLPRYGG